MFIKKESAIGLSEADMIDIFTNSSNLEEIKRAVEMANDRVYVSWATVEAVDKTDEKIPIDEVIKGQDKLMERGAPITYGHSNYVCGKTLAYKVMEHPVSKTLGILHLDKIYNQTSEDDRVWKEIVNKELIGSSVGGFNTNDVRSYDKESNKMITEKRDFHQYETAIVSDPCNQYALNEAVSVVAKSSDNKNSAPIGEKNKEGELIMEEEVKKSFEDITKTLAAIMKKQESMDEEMKKPKEEVVKAEEEVKPKEEEVKKEEEKEKEEEVKKEEAKSDIAPESDAKAPEGPLAERSPDVEVLKAIASLNKKVDALAVTKSETPRPVSNVTKKHNFMSQANDIAKGKKVNINQLNEEWSNLNKIEFI